MSLVALRNVVIDSNRGGRSLFEGFFYCKFVYVGDGYVKYDYFKIKDDDNEV